MKKITSDARAYITTTNSMLPTLAQETRETHMKALCLFLTLSSSILIGSISFMEELELFQTTISKWLSITSWISFGLSIFFLSFGIVRFLVDQACSMHLLMSNYKKALDALVKKENNFEITDSKIFMNFQLSFWGFVFFVLGFLNLLFALITRNFNIYFPLILFFNTILLVCCDWIIKPMHDKNSSLSEIVKKK